ncbi:MAG TPA: hypothetical protein VF608_03845 [Thermoanaerobaculia bacterium]
MSLETALSDVQKSIPECVALGLVDIRTGMLLAIRTVDSHPQEVIDLVAAATGDLFQGANVTAIERLFKRVRGVADNGHHYFQEIIVMSDNLIHVFQRCKRNEDMVMVTVCRISANLGMVLTKARGGLSPIEAAV